MRLRWFALLLVLASTYTAGAKDPIWRDGIAFQAYNGIVPLQAVEWRQIARLLPLRREYTAYFVMRTATDSVTVELRSTSVPTRGYHVSYRKRNGAWVKNEGKFTVIPAN